VTIDLNRYAILLPTVKSFCADNADAEPKEVIDRLTQMTSAPIIVIAHFVGMTIGYKDQINDLINSVSDFYGYDGIIPIKAPSGCGTI
jgi:cytochrome P450